MNTTPQLAPGMQHSQSAVTAAAGIGQEPVVAQVTFAITGVPLVDAMAGVSAVMSAARLNIKAQLRMWEMLAALAKDQIQEDAEQDRARKELSEQMQRMQQAAGAGSIDSTIKPPSLGDYITSSGTAPHTPLMTPKEWQETKAQMMRGLVNDVPDIRPPAKTKSIQNPDPADF